MTKIGPQIQYQDDPIARNAKLRFALAEHYHSILRQVNSGIGDNHPGHDIVDNEWTLKLGEKKSEMQRFEEKLRVTPTFGKFDDCSNIKRDQIYLQQRRVEHTVRDLIRDRGRQIEVYMGWVYATIDNELCIMKIRNIEVGPDDEMRAVERMLMEERTEMELMLVDEVREWEEKLRKCRGDVVTQLFLYYGMDTDMGAKLARRWKAELWDRVKLGELAMNARMNAVGSTVLKRAMDAELDERLLNEIWEAHTSDVQGAWRSLFTENSPTPSPSSHPSSRLNKALVTLACDWGKDGNARSRLQERQQKMANRLVREVEDVEERLGRGLEQCHEIRSPELVKLTHSDSKWPRIESFDEDIIKALKRNKHLIHLSIAIKPDTSEADITRFFDNFNSTSESCTSIHFWHEIRIPDSVLHTLSPNILSITGRQPQSEALNTALEQNRSRLEESRKTTVEFANLTVDSWFTSLSAAASPASFTLGFFGPESSDHLTLQIIHRCGAADACLSFELQGSLFTLPITPSLEFGLQNITIGNNRKLRKPSSGLTFEPGHRNTLTFILPSTPAFELYYLRDVELLDSNGNRYDGEVTSDQEENDTNGKPAENDASSESV